jgi:hypothetical protein
MVRYPSIPQDRLHHEWKIIWLRFIFSVRPEISKGEWDFLRVHRYLNRKNHTLSIDTRSALRNPSEDLLRLFFCFSENLFQVQGQEPSVLQDQATVDDGVGDIITSCGIDEM